MGNKISVLMTINTLANHCGHFYNAYLEDNVSVNNGYNCRHPEAETYDGVGCCYCSSCPLENAYYACDEEACEPYGVEFEECEFMVVEIDESEYNDNIMFKSKEKQ